MLVSAFCRNEDFDGASQVLREMVRRSIPLDSRTVHQVCNGLKHQGKDQLVKKLLQEMEGKKFLQESFNN
jgi:pentatricopeptide repeat protein